MSEAPHPLEPNEAGPSQPGFVVPTLIVAACLAGIAVVATAGSRVQLAPLSPPSLTLWLLAPFAIGSAVLLAVQPGAMRHICLLHYIAFLGLLNPASVLVAAEPLQAKLPSLAGIIGGLPTYAGAWAIAHLAAGLSRRPATAFRLAILGYSMAMVLAGVGPLWLTILLAVTVAVLLGGHRSSGREGTGSAAGSLFAFCLLNAMALFGPGVLVISMMVLNLLMGGAAPMAPAASFPLLLPPGATPGPLWELAIGRALAAAGTAGLALAVAFAWPRVELSPLAKGLAALLLLQAGMIGGQPTEGGGLLALFLSLPMIAVGTLVCASRARRDRWTMALPVAAAIAIISQGVWLALPQNAPTAFILYLGESVWLGGIVGSCYLAHAWFERRR